MYQHEFAKMATFAAIIGLVVARWFSELTAVTVAALVLYLLLVKVG